MSSVTIAFLSVVSFFLPFIFTSSFNFLLPKERHSTCYFIKTTPTPLPVSYMSFVTIFICPLQKRCFHCLWDKGGSRPGVVAVVHVHAPVFSRGVGAGVGCCVPAAGCRVVRVSPGLWVPWRFGGQSCLIPIGDSSCPRSSQVSSSVKDI